jgi:APA family basic amino acid/polyamine antiporter
MAFLCGWSLLLAYTVTASAVAVGFSGYLSGMTASLGLVIPDYLLKTPAEGGLVNLPSIIIILLLCLVLIRGTKQSAKLNFALILVALAAIIAFVVIAAPHAQAANLSPFMPFGVRGVCSGAAIVFFSYMGFDAVATSAEECKCPSRDLPIGIISSIVICMTLYIAVSLSLTAAINYTQLDTPEPVAYALRLLGWPGMANLIAVGVLAGIITTLIVYLFGQSRIFFAVSRDGMLPQKLCKIHPTFHTPYLITIWGSILIAVISGFVPLMHIVELSNTGTLAVFLVNFIGIVVMRRKHPEIPRKFHCPLLYLIAPVGIIVCFYLIYELSTLTHILFAGWILLGLIVYYAYSRKHSIVRE